MGCLKNGKNLDGLALPKNMPLQETNANLTTSIQMLNFRVVRLD